MDSNLEREHARFMQSAFDYVCKLQDVHAEKQYELIEPVRELEPMLREEEEAHARLHY